MEDYMKKKLLLCLLIMISIFIFTGCDKKTEINAKQESITGSYKAFETVQYGTKYTGESVEKENITLVVKDNNTATLKWGNSEGKDYKIEKNQFISLSDDEVADYTFKNGVLKLELKDGTSITFKK